MGRAWAPGAEDSEEKVSEDRTVTCSIRKDHELRAGDEQQYLGDTPVLPSCLQVWVLG